MLNGVEVQPVPSFCQQSGFTYLLRVICFSLSFILKCTVSWPSLVSSSWIQIPLSRSWLVRGNDLCLPPGFDLSSCTEPRWFDFSVSVHQARNKFSSSFSLSHLFLLWRAETGGEAKPFSPLLVLVIHSLFIFLLFSFVQVRFNHMAGCAQLQFLPALKQQTNANKKKRAAHKHVGELNFFFSPSEAVSQTAERGVSHWDTGVFLRVVGSHSCYNMCRKKPSASPSLLLISNTSSASANSLMYLLLFIFSGRQ